MIARIVSRISRSGIDAVLCDEVGIELPTEAGGIRQHEMSVFECGAVRDELPPDRVAVRMKDLDVGAVRLAGEQMERDLWLLVVSEFHAVEPCRGRHPLPVGVPTAPGRIEVADVHGAGLKEVAAAAGRVFALSGADGDAAASPYLAHVATIVGPDAWLLEPANVEVRHAATEVERLLDRVSLVGIDGQHEIISGRLAGDANTLGVGARLEAADLELGTAEAERPPLFHLIADS